MSAASTMPPLELALMLADPDPEQRIQCRDQRRNKWGWVAHTCTWPKGHSGTTHHDAHTSATWKDAPTNS